MKELSIFVDESGDFGAAKGSQAYYLVPFVFHDQSEDISNHVRLLDQSVKQAGFDVEYIHTGPVIRREGVFKAFTYTAICSISICSSTSSAEHSHFLLQQPVNICHEETICYRMIQADAHRHHKSAVFLPVFSPVDDRSKMQIS